MSTVVAGFLLSISLIVAMGPQNILLIKHGIRREGVTAIIVVCILSDVALFVLGVLTVGYLTDALPHALPVLRWVGIVFLGWFAVSSFREAYRRPAAAASIVRTETEPQAPEANVSERNPGGGLALKTRRPSLRLAAHPAIAAIALTWLNPSAYLDGIVMVGGIANQYGEVGRWLFIAGALLASVAWFTGVGYGAGVLHRPLSNPTTWRALNAFFGAVLVALCVKLALMP